MSSHELHEMHQYVFIEGKSQIQCYLSKKDSLLLYDELLIVQLLEFLQPMVY